MRVLFIFLFFSVISSISVAKEVNFNPINGVFGGQFQLNYLALVNDEVAIGPMLGYDPMAPDQDAQNRRVNQWSFGIRMERSPLGFEQNGFYSSLALDLQRKTTKHLNYDCDGQYNSYGGYFLSGYAIRDNKYEYLQNIVAKFGAGFDTSVYFNRTVNCENGETLVLTGIFDVVNLGFIMEASVGYSF